MTQPNYYVLRVDLLAWSVEKQRVLELILNAYSPRHKQVRELKKRKGKHLTYVKGKTKPGVKLGKVQKYVKTCAVVSRLMPCSHRCATPFSIERLLKGSSGYRTESSDPRDSRLSV